MAYYRKTAKGWRVEVERRGVRKSQTFSTKSAAQQWAAREETAILDGTSGAWPRKTVQDALDRYEAEVTVRKRGKRAEGLRLAAFSRDFPVLAGKLLPDVTVADLAAWRDARLRLVTPGSVQRDINLLKHVWSLASTEWEWCASPTPWKAVRAPGNNRVRTRVMGWREIRRLLRRCDYRTGRPPRTPMQAVGWALLVSLRTGMRAGEVVGMTARTVDLRRRVVTLEAHKTVEAVGARQVPVTPQAARLLDLLVEHADDGPLLPVTGASLDALFRKARDQCLLGDMHFHDARATALTHLARRVDVLTLAKISGHRDLRILSTVYYRESAAHIAARLALPRRSPRL